MSIEQVTAVLNGKSVVASPREIVEVKNEADTYALFSKLNPYKESDLLRAHAAMMRNLVNEPGHYRRVGVYIKDSKGEIVHRGADPEDVPQLMAELFDYLRKSKDSALLKGAIFHHRFETIHPFADGNGRMGRLWQSAILNKYNPAFATLPVETIVHDSQRQYYQTLRASREDDDLGPFIEFTLTTLRKALQLRLAERTELPQDVSDKLYDIGDWAELIVQEILLDNNCTTAALSSVCGIGQRMVKEYLSRLQKAGMLRRMGGPRYGHWELTLPGVETPVSARSRRGGR